jgi:hypothetical protein
MSDVIDLINAIEAGKTRECETAFESLIHAKISEKMEERRAEIRANMFESAEQLDELSKGTLASYVKKASSDAGHHRRVAGVELGAGANKRRDVYNDAENKADKRLAGVRKAVDRLTKESEDLDESSMATKDLEAMHALHSHNAEKHSDAGVRKSSAEAATKIADILKKRQADKAAKHASK